MQHGVLARYPVVDVRAVLYKGSHHPVDSSDLAFSIAGSLGFKNAMAQAKPVLLEPIMRQEILVPEEYLGDVMGELNAKRAQIEGIEPLRKRQLIRALVPQAEIVNLAISLRSLTQGRGSFTARFSHYQEVPAHLAEQIVRQRQREIGGAPEEE